MDEAMTPEEIVGHAIAVIREGSGAATPSPWRNRRGPGEHVCANDGSTVVADVATRADRRHIAAWHPEATLAVADMLEAAVRRYQADVAYYADELDCGRYPMHEPLMDPTAVAFARAFLRRGDG